MNKLVLLLVLALCACTVNAQKRTARGLVLDSQSRDPIGHAHVKVHDTTIFTYTADNGEFAVEVPGKIRKLTVSHPDYPAEDVMLHPGFQHRKTRIYLDSKFTVQEKRKRDSSCLLARNTLTISLFELLARAVAFRYERFVGLRHSLGAHVSFFLQGRNIFAMGSEYSYYPEYTGIKMTPAYRFYAIRKNCSGLFVEGKIPIAYMDFSKLDYHSDHYSHIGLDKEVSFWTYGISAAIGFSFVFPGTKHGIMSFSIGYQHLPFGAPEYEEKVINDEVKLTLPHDTYWWYILGPGSKFEMKILIGGIF